MSEKKKLFLSEQEQDKTEYFRIMDSTIRAVADAMNHPHAYAGMEPYDLRKALNAGELLPVHGMGFDAVLKETAEKIMPNLVRTSSTDYMAHLHSPALLESLSAELILSAFNQSMDSWDQSPAATEIEVDVIRKLCTLYGYDENSDGVFTSGGSQSNLTGLLLARDFFCREKLHHDVQKHGLPEKFRKLRLYTSEISHFSMEKSAHLMGLGYESVVKVPVDKSMKMDPVQLKKLIQQDLAAGNIPFCIVATLGTTDFGSIDPLAELRGICDEYGLWLHADAAYGSGVILSDKYAGRVAGLNTADSITVDFHKMFLLPISCSASLIRDRKNMEVLTIHADYLNRVEDEEDGYINLVDKSIQTTRRFDALKVWMSFRTRGQDGWSDLITTCIDNAAYLYEKLKADSRFEPVVKPEISSVVFRVLPPEGSSESADDMNKRIRRELLHHHGTVIGQTVCDGNICLKFTLLNPRVSHEKLDELLARIASLRG